MATRLLTVSLAMSVFWDVPWVGHWFIWHHQTSVSKRSWWTTDLHLWSQNFVYFEILIFHTNMGTISSNCTRFFAQLWRSKLFRRVANSSVYFHSILAIHIHTSPQIWTFQKLDAKASLLLQRWSPLEDGYIFSNNEFSKHLLLPFKIIY